MSEKQKRMLALIVVLAALALLVVLGCATVAALASEAIVTVCPPPGAGCDYTTIQEAVDNADSGDTIRVAQGTYTENLTITQPITLAGGYSGPPAWTRDLALYETIVDGSESATAAWEWDSNSIAFPRVISDTDSSRYLMWYQGQSLASSGWGWALGLAESPDGLNWTKYVGNPILEPGEEGAWDSAYRGQVSMLKENGLYRMWYSGSDGGPWQTGYATSTDGVDWSIHAGNPVLTVGGGGSWDGQEADGPTVIKDDGLYKMWYHGCDADNTACSIGYATSTNGRDWSKYAGNPVLTGTGGEWDAGTALWPSVVKDGGTYKMWYNGGGGRIGLATSPDGVNWTKEATNPVLTEGWGGQAAYAHTVSREGGTYKMWLRSGAGDSIGIGYAESDDGIDWTMSISNPLLTLGTVAQGSAPVVRFEGGSDGSILDGLTITGGSAPDAGGVEASDAEITIRRCYIHDNFADGTPDNSGGGGVRGGNHGTLLIEDSLIVDNAALAGASGVRVGQAHLVMTNTLVANNGAAEGLHLNGSAALMNVTIAGNGTQTGRPGINFNPQAGGTLEMVNSIIYGNGDVIHVDNPNWVQSTYSDIQRGWAGTGNVDADPKFVDPSNGDYHLLPWSPCRDKGTSVGAPASDIEGTPRDAEPDIGAYEWTGFRILLPLVVRNQ